MQATLPSATAFYAPALPTEPLTDSGPAWLALDQIDYGLLLVSPCGLLQHANRLGRQELGRARFLQLEGAQLVGSSQALSEELQNGIRAAAQGRRMMLTLRNGDGMLTVACVPLGQAAAGGAASVMLTLARQPGTENLNLTFFSRSHGLTPAEEAVLKALCEGMDVREIAEAKGVTEYTVRSQVRSLRDKTGVNSVRLLVQRVAALPPLVPMSLTIGAPAAAQWQA